MNNHFIWKTIFIIQTLIETIETVEYLCTKVFVLNKNWKNRKENSFYQHPIATTENRLLFSKTEKTKTNFIGKCAFVEVSMFGPGFMWPRPWAISCLLRWYLWKEPRTWKLLHTKQNGLHRAPNKNRVWHLYIDRCNTMMMMMKKQQQQPKSQRVDSSSDGMVFFISVVALVYYYCARNARVMTLCFVHLRLFFLIQYIVLLWFLCMILNHRYVYKIEMWYDRSKCR